MGNKNCAVGLTGRSPAITNNDRRAAEGVHPARPSRQTGSLWRLAPCCTFAALLAPAQIAFADDLGTKNLTRKEMSKVWKLIEEVEGPLAK